MSAPEWVSKELFEKALRAYLNNKNIQILEYTSSAALPIGENYSSDLFRTVVSYTTGEKECEESISLIVKCSPQVKGAMKDAVEEMAFFDTEVTFYTKIVPYIYEILGTPKYLSAQCLYTNENNSIIVLEDLKALGFTMASRQNGLDLDHCLLFLDKLAYCHAGSSVFAEQNMELVSKYNKGIFRSNEFNASWIKLGYESLIDACSRWPGYEKYCDKLNGQKDRALEKTLATLKVNKDGFNVINHGDLWVNNFMFLYDPEGKPIDIRYVDFQLVLYTSPAIDLIYFWSTSPNLEVRNKHIEEIIDCYHDKLSSTLKQLKVAPLKIPTKKELRRDCDSRAFYGLTASMTILPFVLASTRSDASVNNLREKGGEGSFRHHAYNNERYRSHMQYLLPFFDSLGVFDS